MTNTSAEKKEDFDVIEPDERESSGALVELVTKAEIDTAIATAKRYPRSVKVFMETAKEMVTINQEIAESCNYGLPRGGKIIEGPSARFAEIILTAWGNCRAGARIVHEDSRFITAQGVCHDLQTNTAVTMEVRRRITDKKGNTFVDDMIGVTGNAASSIALRNAILRKVPKAFWDPIYQESRKVALGAARPMANRRADALAVMQKFGVTPDMIYAKFGIKGEEDLTIEHLTQLNACKVSLKEGVTTIEELFPKITEEKKGNEGVKEKLRGKGAKKPKEETPPAPKEEAPIPASPNTPEVNFPEPELDTPEKVKLAGETLVAALKVTPEDQRSGIFVSAHGMEIAEALKAAGQGLIIGKLRDLGIKLPF